MRERKGQNTDDKHFGVKIFVALAILAILLYFLVSSLIITEPPYSRDYKDTIRRHLQEINLYTQGFGISIPYNVTIPQGSSFFSDEVVTGVAIKAEDVKFVCDDSSICNNNPLEIRDDALRSSAKLSVFVVVCGNEGKANKPYYCISFARKREDAADACITACEMR